MEIAIKIRNLYPVYNQSELARMFDTTPQNVHLIVNNRIWKETPVVTLEEYILAHTKKGPKENSCWLWTGPKDIKGYGSFQKDFVHYYAHRASWIINKGPIPDKQHVLHTCDTPACVRPEHLFLGNQRINALDMIAKGRHARGENYPTAVLTWEKVRLIRSYYRNGVSMREIALEFDISNGHVHSVVTNKVWKE
jgi:hypothetical protein